MKKYGLNILGSSLLAFGICAFIVPFDIIAGGATGISIVFHKLFGINMSIVVLIINLTCLPIGYIFGGKDLCLGSILSSFVYPLALSIFERMPQITTIADNIFVAIICAGVICGTGIGLVIKSGGSTGGVDIPCILIGKYLHKPVNTIMNICDSIIMCSQIPFSNITYVVYGLIYTYIMTEFISKAIALGEDRYKVEVISEQFEEITDALLHNDFGVTLSYVQSGYCKVELQKIECVMDVKRLRFHQMLVESIDPTAFITIERVKDVKGRGYTLEKQWL